MTLKCCIIKLSSTIFTFWSIIKLLWCRLIWLSKISCLFSTRVFLWSSCCSHCLSKHLTLCFPFCFFRIVSTYGLILKFCFTLLCLFAFLIQIRVIIITIVVLDSIIICICSYSLLLHVKWLSFLNKYFLASLLMF